MSEIYLEADAFTPEVIVGIAVDTGLPLREIARQSGIPYSTLQGWTQIGGPTPTAANRALLENWLAAGPVETEKRLSTWQSTTGMWSDRKLANLAPPQGATHFRLVVQSPGTPTGFTSTPYDELRKLSPYDQAFELGIDARSVAKVIWTRAGSLPGAS